MVYIDGPRYPLLWNTPAESQEELVQIMNSVKSLHGIEQDREIGILTSAASLWEKRSTIKATQKHSVPRRILTVEDMENRKPEASWESCESIPEYNHDSQRHQDGFPFMAGNRRSGSHISASVPVSLPGLLNEDEIQPDDPAENV